MRYKGFLHRYLTGFMVLSVVSLCLCTNAIADKCPTAKDIQYRLVPETYEWTVEEGVTLEQLLSVERLFSVSIESNGEFVSCKYTVKEKFLKLDGLPKKNNCKLVLATGQWITTKTGRSICDEQDVTQCIFNMSCEN